MIPSSVSLSDFVTVWMMLTIGLSYCGVVGFWHTAWLSDCRIGEIGDGGRDRTRTNDIGEERIGDEVKSLAVNLAIALSFKWMRVDNSGGARVQDF